MAIKSHIKIGGSWVPATNVWVRENGSWAEKSIPHVKDGGVWKPCMSYDFKVSLDGVDDYISFTNIGQDIYKYVAKIETPSGIDTGSANWGFFNLYNSARPYMLAGDVSGAVSGESMTIFDIVGGNNKRTWTGDSFSSGIITLSVEWNGSNYVFKEDGVAKATTFTDGHLPLISSCDCFGARNGGNFAGFDVHSLEIHGAGGILHKWDMNEGSGTTLIDSVGSNDATLHGGSWVEV